MRKLATMRLLHAHLLALAAALLLAPSCASLAPHGNSQPRLTAERTPREGQKLWFTPQQTQEAAHIVAACISASEMATDFQRARRAYADFLRSCYATFSQNGLDVDAGVRALNLVRHLHRAADGSPRLWHAAVELAKDTQSPDLQGIPIPQAY